MSQPGSPDRHADHKRQRPFLASIDRRPGRDLDPEQQLEALKKVQQQAEQRVRLGMQLFKAAETRLTTQQGMLAELRDEQDRLRSVMREELDRQVGSLANRISGVDDRVTEALEAIGERISAAERDWQQAQRQIRQLTDRCEKLARQAGELIESAERHRDATRIRGFTGVHTIREVGDQREPARQTGTDAVDAVPTSRSRRRYPGGSPETGFVPRLTRDEVDDSVDRCESVDADASTANASPRPDQRFGRRAGDRVNATDHLEGPGRRLADLPLAADADAGEQRPPAGSQTDTPAEPMTSTAIPDQGATDASADRAGESIEATPSIELPLPDLRLHGGPHRDADPEYAVPGAGASDSSAEDEPFSLSDAVASAGGWPEPDAWSAEDTAKEAVDAPSLDDVEPGPSVEAQTELAMPPEPVFLSVIDRLREPGPPEAGSPGPAEAEPDEPGDDASDRPADAA